MKRAGGKLTVFLMCVYAVSYVTRVNFGAVVSEAVAATGLSKEILSYPVTAAFISYGAGQLLSGWLGDKIQPKYLLFTGLLTSSAMNLSMVFLSSPAAMTAVWCVNGLSQAFLWPPIVRLLACSLDPDGFKRGTVVVSYGISIGTILVYLLSPLIITVASWRAVFAVSSAAGSAAALCALLLCPRTESAGKGGVKEPAPTRSGWALVFSPAMAAIMAAIICQGALRDGVTTWMPSFISETYSLGAATAILTGVLLPLFGMACLRATEAVHAKAIKNPFVCAGTIFGVGVASAASLFLVTGRSAALSVLFSAILTGTMHGVNLILVCMLPGYFSKTGKVAFVSGALNTCTYIGSAASTYLVPIVTKNGQWGATVAVWCGIAAVGCALSFIARPLWRRR